MDKLFINYSGNIESFKRLGLEETYKKCIVFIEKDGAIYTHSTYYAGPDIIKSIQEALGELQLEVKEGDYVSSIKQVDGKIEATMGTFEKRDSKILEDSKSYTDDLKRDVTTAITAEYNRAIGVEQSLSDRINSHLDITERELSEKADKDSVYDKEQIDLKLTGVYKIKGSCTFESLPETNKVGDVYNITDPFTLDEKEYTAGTNIVYTENGWDVLAGIFDTSELELEIQRVSNLLALEVVRAIKAENGLEDKINEGVIRALEKELELDKKFDNYLPLVGGIINGALKIKSDKADLLLLEATGVEPMMYFRRDGLTITRLYANSTSGNLYRTNAGFTENYKIWDLSNFNPNDYLPLNTSKMLKYNMFLLGAESNIDKGYFAIHKNASDTIDYGTMIIDTAGNNTVGIILSPFHGLLCKINNDHTTIWHEGNDGHGSGLDADTLDGYHVSSIFKYVGDTTLDGAPTLWDQLGKKTYNNCLPDGLTNAYQYGQVISFGEGNSRFDMYVSHLSTDPNHDDNLGGIRVRSGWNDDKKSWRKLAFTDSTVENANKLNNKSSSDFYDLVPTSSVASGTDLDTLFTPGSYSIGSDGIAASLKNCPITTGGTIVISKPLPNTGYIKQEVSAYLSATVYHRTYMQGTWRDWELKSTNLNLYTAPSASKLITPDHGEVITVNKPNWNNRMILRTGWSDTFGDWVTLYVPGSTTNVASLRMVQSGNVGIGVNDPLAKLDVNGNVNVKGLYSSESITVANGKGIYINDSSGNNPNVLLLNSSNNLLLGYGSSARGYKTTIEGNTIDFKYGTNHSTGMVINSNGNIGIGTTDPQYKLDVNGDVAATLFYAARTISSDVPMFYCSATNDPDVTILRIDQSPGNTTYKSNYGYSLKYIGSGNGKDNLLNLYADNLLATTQVLAISVNNQGNVGIGTTDPQYKLEVNGSLHTNSLSIQSDVKVDNLNADKLDGYEAEDFALKSDLIIGENITDGVYAVRADESLCTVDEADTSCIGVALIQGEHKLMIAKSDATDGTNSALYWTKSYSELSLTNYSNVNGNTSFGYLQKPDGTFHGTPHLSEDFTTWTVGALSDFNGKANTEVIAAASNDARDMCTVLNTFNASDSHNDWYVPACGQLALMYLNIAEIEAALAKIGGTALYTGSYWSSTECFSDYAWTVNPFIGEVNRGYYKNTNLRVRFVRDLQIEPPKSVKDVLIETVSKVNNLEAQIRELMLLLNQ